MIRHRQAMKLNEKRQITLADGRILGFASYGALRGEPIFYFHGFPSSRLEAHFAHDLGLAKSARIIAPDRPGYGLSDFLADRTIPDWPRDVLQLADALGIDRFLVMAVSGGCPYALACAHAIPDRITAVGIVCGLGPIDSPEDSAGMVFLNRLGLFLGAKIPTAVRPLFVLVAIGLRYFPGATVDFIAARLPGADRRALRRPEVKRLLAGAFRESVRAGSRGPVRDVLLYSRPWGFDLGEILPPVHLWHGERDTIVPSAMGRNLAKQIPGASLTLYPEEGHFSLIVRRVSELMDELVERREP